MPSKNVSPVPDGAAQTDKGRGSTGQFPTPGLKNYRVGPGTSTPNDNSIDGLERMAPRNRSTMLTNGTP